MTRILRSVMLAMLPVLALAAVDSPARAEYPDHAIKAIVPFAPGGANDTMARLLAPAMAKVLGQPIVIENKPGAAGNLGIDIVARSAPDGYTIVFSATASTQNPALFKTMPFDPFKDIRAIAKIGEGAYAIVVNPKLPIKTVAELVDYGKKNPGKLNGASGGIGTRLSIELFQIQNGITVQIIPYDGTGPASVAVMSGEADFAIMDTSAMVGSMISNRIRGVAIAGDARLPSLPDVPTTTEAGFPGYKTGTLFGLYAQGKTPDDVTKKLNGAMNQVLAMPYIIEQLAKLGVVTDARSPEDFAKQYQAEIVQWKDIVTKAKIPLLD